MLDGIKQRFQSARKAIKNNYFDVDGAAPNNYNSLEVAYQPLFRTTNGKEEFVGFFSIDLYLLAKTKKGSLPAQIEEAKWCATQNNLPAIDSPAYIELLKTVKPPVNHSDVYNNLYEALYRAGTTERKSPFELAVFYPNNTDYTSFKSQSEMEERIVAVFAYRLGNKLGLPNFVSKLRLKDYLNNNIKEFKEAGLLLKDGTGIGHKLNIPNTPDKAWYQHKVLQYIGSWFAVLTTLSAALLVTGPVTPVVLVALGIATAISRRSLNDFSWYDNAEETNRLLGWYHGWWKGEFALKGDARWSWKNLLVTTVQLGAIVWMMALAAKGALISVMELPWNAIAAPLASMSTTLGLSSTALLSLAQVSLGITLAGGAAIGMYLGASFTLRYLRRFSPWDNEIHNIDKKMVDALPTRADPTGIVKDFRMALEKQPLEVRQQVLAGLSDLMGPAKPVICTPVAPTNERITLVEVSSVPAITVGYARHQQQIPTFTCLTCVMPVPRSQNDAVLEPTPAPVASMKV
jgi:hypothetical protein